MSHHGRVGRLTSHGPFAWCAWPASPPDDRFAPRARNDGNDLAQLRRPRRLGCRLALSGIVALGQCRCARSARDADRRSIAPLPASSPSRWLLPSAAAPARPIAGSTRSSCGVAIPCSMFLQQARDRASGPAHAAVCSLREVTRFCAACRSDSGSACALEPVGSPDAMLAQARPAAGSGDRSPSGAGGRRLRRQQRGAYAALVGGRGGGTDRRSLYAGRARHRAVAAGPGPDDQATGSDVDFQRICTPGTG